MIAVLLGCLLGMAPTRLMEEPIRIQIAPTVEVRSERLKLGEVAQIRGGTESIRAQLESIELGASPLPGQTRLFTRQQLLIRLRQHRIAPETVQIEMPDTIRITRTGQAVEVSAVEKFAREQVSALTGHDLSEWRLENPPRPTALPEGEIEWQIASTPRIHTTTAVVEVVARVDGQVRGQYLLRFRAPARARQVLVRTGDTVQVSIRAESVVLEVRGQARASGADSKVIPVYISETQRTLRARVVEQGRVEVRL